MRATKCGPFLGGILERAEADLARAQAALPESDLRRRLDDAPPARSFSSALRAGFGIIAEIKEKSPSGGPMIPENVAAAGRAFEESSVVKAISVLTNRHDFGMTIQRLERARKETTKPILRKDFIFSEYQVLEARVFGADAILLMANILDKDELVRLGGLASELGMDVLFESHNLSEIRKIPDNAVVFGINCRKLDSKNPLGSYFGSRVLRRVGLFRDLSIQDEPLKLVDQLPHDSVKVAESGITPGKIAAIRDVHKFDAALIGNALLLAKEGVVKKLAEFEDALAAREECPSERRTGGVESAARLLL